MTKDQVISRFRLYMDDTSELSSTEEGNLFDKWYYKVSSDRPWEYLKVEHSATTDGTVNVALPTRFAYIVSNANHTDSSYEAERPVVFVGPNYDEYQVVSFSDRRQYRNQNNICWVDFRNGNLVFAVAPSSGLAVEFDYVERPVALTGSDELWMPLEYQDIVYHGMCSDDFIIQQSEKAKSYRDENRQSYESYLSDMTFWNSQLQQM